jgi:O-antigen/teichoic acid export membrane protein
VVFGNDWRLAGTLAALLAIGLYAQFVVSPLATIPTLLEHQALQIRWDAIRMVTTIALPLMSYRCGASLEVTTLVLGGAFAFMYGSFFVLSDRLASAGDRRLRESVGDTR